MLLYLATWAWETSSIRNKFLIEEKSLVTQIAVASWSGISIIALWTFLFLICLGSFGFYLANEIEAVSENAIGEALGISTFSKYIMTYYDYGNIEYLYKYTYKYNDSYGAVTENLYYHYDGSLKSRTEYIYDVYGN